MTQSAQPMTTDRLERFLGRIAGNASDYSAPPLLIVALGDSVTQGYTARATIDHEGVYHARLKRKLEALYRLTTFSVLNAGAAGHTVPDALKRLERDVIRHDPDLIVVAFGLNAAAQGGLEGVRQFKTDLNHLLERIDRDTKAQVLLVTPSFTLKRVSERIHPEELIYVPGLLPLQGGGVVAAYAAAIRQVGAARGLPVADVYAAWETFERAGVDTDAMLSNGLNHPTGEAHAITADLLFDLITLSDITRSKIAQSSAVQSSAVQSNAIQSNFMQPKES
jgi:acyl-CoA thioesterase I